VLEVGSGSGVCADYLESVGITVDRTDAVESFIDYQKSLGKSIEILNILNNTASQKYNFILANAVLHHFTSDELQVVLNNIKESLNEGGLFAFSVNIGTGEELTNQKMDAPRYYKYWTQESLKPILSNSGFKIIDSQENVYWLRIVVQKI
jgi:predicted TPR repeat methyltransferase